MPVLGEKEDKKADKEKLNEQLILESIGKANRFDHRHTCNNTYTQNNLIF